MKVLILTSSVRGIASHHLSAIHANKDVSEILVVLNQNEIKDKKKFYVRKLKKMLKIGLLGTINGIKMRRWYNEDIESYLDGIRDIEGLCSELGVQFKKVSRINCQETIDLFQDFSPTVGISLGNGYIGSKVFSIPSYGMLNIHHEILPAYQNAQSVIWQIYNMSRFTGYTIHQIDKRIDTGKIVLQEVIQICFSETLGATVSKTLAECYEASAKGLNRVLSDLEHMMHSAKSQGAGGHYTTPSWREMKRIKKNFDSLTD